MAISVFQNLAIFVDLVQFQRKFDTLFFFCVSLNFFEQKKEMFCRALCIFCKEFLFLLIFCCLILLCNNQKQKNALRLNRKTCIRSRMAAICVSRKASENVKLIAEPMGILLLGIAMRFLKQSAPNYEKRLLFGGIYCLNAPFV